MSHSKMDIIYDNLFEKVSDLDGVEDLKIEPTQNDMEKEFLECSLYCTAESVHNLKTLFENEKSNIEKSLNLTIQSITCEIGQVPTSFIEVTDAELAESIQTLIEKLNDHDDVQNVYHNAQFNIPEEEE